MVTTNVYGLQLKSVDRASGEHCVETVDGVSYYVHDFGGYLVGSRQARRVDFGGNPHSEWRAAPSSTMGLAAKLNRGTLPTKIQYSAPEVVFLG